MNATTTSFRLPSAATSSASSRPEPEVSLLRLYLLRAMYLLVVVGLGSLVWPQVVDAHRAWSLWEGVVQCMLAAFSLLCLLGLRHPLKMLPVLVWEMAWKVIWLGVVALPAWRAGTLDAGTTGVMIQCSLVLLIPLVLPWGYLRDAWLKAPGARWR